MMRGSVTYGCGCSIVREADIVVGVKICEKHDHIYTPEKTLAQLAAAVTAEFMAAPSNAPGQRKEAG